MPSNFTTARTGPVCSTVTFFTRLTNFSCGRTSSGFALGAALQDADKLPRAHHVRPSTVIESTRFMPPVAGIEHCSAPVSIDTVLPS